jgi:hypothetical protein
MSKSASALPTLQHVTFTYPSGQGDTLREFYTKYFGLNEKPVPKVVESLGWIWFQTSSPDVGIHFVPDEEPVSSDTAYHFCLHVSDLAGCKRRLVDNGFPIREARPLPFRPRFFTRDPFNNLIEVLHLEGDYLAAGQ